jgi:hypothetical protein
MGFIEKTPDLEKRLGTATGGTPPTEDQKRSVAQLQRRALQLGQAIDAFVPYGRQKNLALTDLESVLMRAVKGVFVDAEPREPEKPAEGSEPPVTEGRFRIQLSDAVGTIPGWRFDTREQARERIDRVQEEVRRGTKPGLAMDPRWVSPQVIEDPIV